MAEKKYPTTNKSKSLEAFKGRSDYRNKYNRTAEKTYCDFWHENMLYGRVDHGGFAIVPKNTFLTRVTGRSKKSQIFILNFVADAYSDMLKKLNRLKKVGKISNNSVFYNAAATKGAFDHTGYFNGLIMINHDAYKSYLLRFNHINRKISNFDLYMEHYLQYAKVAAQFGAFYLTKTSTLSTSRVPPTVSGLVVQLFEDEVHDVDQDKVDKYFKDEAFELFRNVCVNHGFMIDVNAPWRIVADLGSPAMLEKMQKYNLTVENLFDTAYSKTYEQDYSYIQRFLVSSYNLWVRDYPFSKSTRADATGRLKHNVVRRTSTTLENETAEINNEKWIDAYVKIRNIECGSPWSEIQIKTIISNAAEINQYISLDKALDYVNNELRAYNMIAYDFGFDDQPEPVVPGVGNVVAPRASSDSAGGSSAVSSGGSSGGSSGY